MRYSSFSSPQKPAFDLICARTTRHLKWYYDQKAPYLVLLHFESMIYNYLPCQILGLDFNEKSEFLDFELSIKLPAITQFKNGRVQKRVGSREDVMSSNEDI